MLKHIDVLGRDKSQDAWLLKAATEECRQRFGDSFGALAGLLELKKTLTCRFN